MRKRCQILTCLLAALALSVRAGAQEQVPVFDVGEIEKIRAAEGKVAKVRGVVESTGRSKGSGMNFLNFPGGEFIAVVFGRSLKNFPEGEPADIYKEKWVEVSGTIEFYKDEPQIIVENPGQIIVLDPATKKPVVTEQTEPAPEPEPEPAGEPEKKKPEVPDPGKVDPRDYFDDP